MKPNQQTRRRQRSTLGPARSPRIASPRHHSNGRRPPGTSDAREIREVYSATPDSVCDARRAASEFAERVGGDIDTVKAIALTVTEACANVAIHAYRDQSSPGEMVVIVTEASPTLTVQVIDHGVGLSPRVDSPGLGLGLPLMSRLSRRLEVETRQGAGTEIRMQFDLAS